MRGRVNTTPYHERGGWCCAEFAVAKKNGCLNLADTDVQALLTKRRWPSNVDEYAAMMENDDDGSPPVRFTNKGDVAAVLYNFFKMTSRCGCTHTSPAACRSSPVS